MSKPKTRTLDKMREANAEGSQTVGNFIEWLESKGIFFARYHDHEKSQCGEGEYRNTFDCGYGEDAIEPIHKSIENWLAEYFKIDLNKAEKERQAILADLQRRANA